MNYDQSKYLDLHRDKLQEVADYLSGSH